MQVSKCWHFILLFFVIFNKSGELHLLHKTSVTPEDKILSLSFEIFNILPPQLIHFIFGYEVSRTLQQVVHGRLWQSWKEEEKLKAFCFRQLVCKDFNKLFGSGVLTFLQTTHHNNHLLSIEEILNKININPTITLKDTSSKEFTCLRAENIWNGLRANNTRLKKALLDNKKAEISNLENIILLSLKIINGNYLAQLENSNIVVGIYNYSKHLNKQGRYVGQRSTIYWALQSPKILKFLLENGALPNLSITRNYQNELQKMMRLRDNCIQYNKGEIVCDNKNTKLIDKLKKLSALEQYTNNEDTYPRYIYDVITLLKKYKADPTFVCNYKIWNHIDVHNNLGVKINEDYSHITFDDFQQLIERFMEKKFPPNILIGNRLSLFTMYLEKASSFIIQEPLCADTVRETIEKMIAYGFDVNIQNSSTGNTPLNCYCINYANGNRIVFDKIIAILFTVPSLDVNIANNLEKTPIFYASPHYYKLLFERNALITSRPAGSYYTYFRKYLEWARNEKELSKEEQLKTVELLINAEIPYLKKHESHSIVEIARIYSECVTKNVNEADQEQFFALLRKMKITN